MTTPTRMARPERNTTDTAMGMGSPVAVVVPFLSCEEVRETVGSASVVVTEALGRGGCGVVVLMISC